MSQKVNTCFLIPHETINMLIYKDFLISHLLKYVVLLSDRRE